MVRDLFRLTAGRRDTLRAVGMVLGYPLARVSPVRADPWLVDRALALLVRLPPNKLERFATRMAASLGGVVGARDMSDQARHHYAMMLESAVGRVRGMHRLWRPEVEIEGLDRLQEARRGGQGSILWRMSFCSTILVKYAMSRAGVPLVHLSKAEHGATSDAWIAKRVLCPLHRRAEDCYLDTRVVIPWKGSPVASMRALLKRLQTENAVVSTFGDLSGANTVTTEVLGAPAHFAVGAPALAWKAGSALLTVYAVREGTNRYRVVIDEPVLVDRSSDRQTFIRLAIAEFARRLEKTIGAHPGSWMGWGAFWDGDPPYHSTDQRVSVRP